MINFGKISPRNNAYNSDISLIEANEDSLLSINDNEICKNKQKKDIIDNEDLLLLNRKRK